MSLLGLVLSLPVALATVPVWTGGDYLLDTIKHIDESITLHRGSVAGEDARAPSE